MNTIIYDARRIKAYEKLLALCEYTGRNQEFSTELWKALMSDGDLMREFAYYLDHHELLDEMKCHGYGLTDLYVWRLERYNLMQDYGKNGPDCNKEAMVLDTFYMMAELKKNPEEYIKRLNDDTGYDKR